MNENVAVFSSFRLSSLCVACFRFFCRCFILPLARKPGRYEIKFIVDGRYVCDGSQTVVAVSPRGRQEWSSPITCDSDPFSFM